MKASLVWSSVALPVCLSLAACTSAPAPADAGESALSAQSCPDQSTALDAALASGAPSYDSVLTVTTERCGTSFHSAGPSALGPERLVRIGSITKTYVAIATLQNVAEGRIALDDLVSAHLDDLPPSIGPITIRQTLQHTSGVFNYTELESFWEAFAADPMRELTPRELVAYGAGQSPYFAPGEGWQYSNTNYVLLGMLLERVEGAPIASILRRRILAPNHLDHTFLAGSEAVSGVLAPGFDQSGGSIGESYSLSWAWAAGAMVATPDDTARFITLVGTGALLPPTLQAELTRGVPTPQPGLSYGLGVFLTASDLSGGFGAGIGHGGDIPGYHSLGLYYPERKTTLFGVVNSDSASSSAPFIAAFPVLMPSAGEARPIEPTRRSRL